jgi:anaerobic ribonucleoside-triphosphate reductase
MINEQQNDILIERSREVAHKISAEVERQIENESEIFVSQEFDGLSTDQREELKKSFAENLFEYIVEIL